MTGQVWMTPSEGGYLYSDQLSKFLRMKVQPISKMRALCDPEDGTQKTLHTGDQFTWDVYSGIAKQGGRLAETSPVPESSFSVRQASMTLTEWGNSVPFTGKLDAFSAIPVKNIIDRVLQHDARRCFDIEAYLQMMESPLRAAPTSGTSTTAITLTEDGTCATTNDVAYGTGHVKAISDAMMERNIPPFEGDNYFAVSHPSSFRPIKNSMESIHQYTAEGLTKIRQGEIGRYESMRFIQQTHIPKGGAQDSTTFDPWTGTADAWNNGKSSWILHLGMDTVTEAIVIPEEIRAKLPTDFGRSKGIAWYALGGFALTHPLAMGADDARVVVWDSAA